MAEAAAIISLSAAAVVEDVLRQHGCRLSDRDLASRRAEEAGAVRAPPISRLCLFCFSLLPPLLWRVRSGGVLNFVCFGLIGGVQRRGGTRRRGGCAARWGRSPRATCRRSRPRRSSASASATARSSAARSTGSTRAPSRRQALLVFVNLSRSFPPPLPSCRDRRPLRHARACRWS